MKKLPLPDYVGFKPSRNINYVVIAVIVVIIAYFIYKNYKKDEVN